MKLIYLTAFLLAVSATALIGVQAGGTSADHGGCPAGYAEDLQQLERGFPCGVFEANDAVICGDFDAVKETLSVGEQFELYHDNPVFYGANGVSIERPHAGGNFRTYFQLCSGGNAPNVVFSGDHRSNDHLDCHPFCSGEPKANGSQSFADCFAIWAAELDSTRARLICAGVGE